MQLDWRFCVVHYGQKPPVEAPTRPVPGVADLPVDADVPSVDADVVTQLEPEDQLPPATPDCPDCDAAVAIEAVGGYVPFVELDYVPCHQMPCCGFVEGVAWDDADGCWITKVAYPAAPLFTAPQWHRTRREHRDEGEGGSVAGWSELKNFRMQSRCCTW